MQKAHVCALGPIFSAAPLIPNIAGVLFAKSERYIAEDTNQVNNLSLISIFRFPDAGKSVNSWLTQHKRLI
jgi:hypothetical protein